MLRLMHHGLGVPCILTALALVLSSCGPSQEELDREAASEYAGEVVSQVRLLGTAWDVRLVGTEERLDDLREIAEDLEVLLRAQEPVPEPARLVHERLRAVAEGAQEFADAREDAVSGRLSETVCRNRRNLDQIIPGQVSDPTSCNDERNREAEREVERAEAFVERTLPEVVDELVQLQEAARRER